MDPVANTLAQVALAESILAGHGVSTDDAQDLAELVLALHKWRQRGGFDPYVAQPAILGGTT